MRTLKELLYTVEQVFRGGKEISSKELSAKDYRNYRKVKELLENGTLDRRSLKVNLGLRNKLYSEVFNYRPSIRKYTLRQRNVIDTMKQMAIARLLIGLETTKHAHEILKSVFRKSVKYTYTRGALESSRELFYREAQMGNWNTANKYFNACNDALNKIQFEIKAEWYDAELRYFFKISKEITDEIRIKSNQYFTELNSVPKESQTHVFYRRFSTIAIINFESSFDFVSLCEWLEQAIGIFENDFDDQSGVNSMRIYLINYLLRINEIEKCREEIKIAYDSYERNSQRWFRLKELDMLYHLKINKWNRCIEIFKETKKQSRYNLLANDAKSRIEMNWLYALMCSALSLGKSKGRKIVKGIKIARFLNSIPVFTADKKGMNIAMIIVQLLYYIIQEDYTRLNNRFEAVEKYLSRYMRIDPLYRSHSFIKMLLQVPKQNFHPVAVKRHTRKFYTNLLSVPFLESKHPNELELVEYEVLWGLLLDYLNTK